MSIYLRTHCSVRIYNGSKGENHEKNGRNVALKGFFIPNSQNAKNWV